MEITLTVGQALWAFILALGIPSAVTGFLVWNFERKIAKREAKREKEQEERHKKEAEREKAREELQILTIQGVSARLRRRPCSVSPTHIATGICTTL